MFYLYIHGFYLLNLRSIESVALEECLDSFEDKPSSGLLTRELGFEVKHILVLFFAIVISQYTCFSEGIELFV